MYNFFDMPTYPFRCLNDDCKNVFDIIMTVSEYCATQTCPTCNNDAQRIYTVVAVHQGRTLSQKQSGASLKTIEHGKYMKDAREKRKKNYHPDSREAQSNELWTGSEVNDGIIDAPDKK
jgi:putative FmdB family regulatory protein